MRTDQRLIADLPALQKAIGRFHLLARAYLFGYGYPRLPRDGLRQPDRALRPALIPQSHLSKGRLCPLLRRHHCFPVQHSSLLSLASLPSPSSILPLLHSNVAGTSQVLVLVATRSSGDCVEQIGRTPTRTSTRPPHPLHPAPCPYRTLGRKHLNGYDYPIRSSTFIRYRRH